MVGLRERRKSEAAYTLVDLSDLDDDLRRDIVQDANEGGGTYGIRVVEESVNGGARAPIFGVYKEGPDAERWAGAKKELNLAGTEVDDAGVYAGAGVMVTDPLREAALREAAAQRAEEEAQRIRAGENVAIEEIVGKEEQPAARPPVGRPTGQDHPINIIDPGLAADATNEAAKAGPAKEGQKTSSPPQPKTKTPK